MIAPYTRHGADIPPSGVIITSPHSGRIYPNDVLKWVNVPMHTLRKLEDPYVDVLLEQAITQDITAMFATYARCVVDLNRAPNELDPKLMRFTGQGYANTQRVRQGLGIIPRVAEHTQAIYRGMLPWQEVKRRIDTCYTPFHEQLAQCIQQAHGECGQALVLDFHSMPSTPPQGYTRLTDIVLGDMNGASCDDAILCALEQAFRRHGLSVARNAPYAGGYITHHYGKPLQNTHVVQIEINRALYLNEQTYALNAQVAPLQTVLASVVQAMLHGFSPAPRVLAAE